MSKWAWMMDWCKKQGLPPARIEVWRAAEKAWNDLARRIEGGNNADN